jgi:hypothetical protein
LFLRAEWCVFLSLLMVVFLFLVLWNGYNGEGVTTLYYLGGGSNVLYTWFIYSRKALDARLVVLQCHEAHRNPWGLHIKQDPAALALLD